MDFYNIFQIKSKMGKKIFWIAKKEKIKEKKFIKKNININTINLSLINYKINELNL